MATTPTTFLRLLADFLVSVTTDPDARRCMVRVAAVRPITGTLGGWSL